MKSSQATKFRVGLFVLISLLIGGAIAFAIGTQENIFTPKTDYHAVFREVGGLQAGSAVWLAGVNVGTVTEVTFDDTGSIRVEFNIVDGATHLIRGDPNTPHGAGGSVAGVGTKGLLGDRLIEVRVGDPSLPLWNPDEPLPPAGGGGLMALAQRTLAEVEGTAHNLRLATDPFSDQEFSYDLKKTAQNLAKVTGMLAHNEGTIQRLINDEKLSQDFAGAVRNFSSASKEVAALSKDLQGISKEIRTGEGTAHALIYGTEGAEAIANIRDASGSLAALLKEVREGDGTIHRLVYGDVGDSFFDNLNNASEDIAFLTKEMREGRGTIGALMTDPSVYEDIKRLIGDLERNDILRALVRYSIRRDEAREPPEVQEVSASQEPPNVQE